MLIRDARNLSTASALLMSACLSACRPPTDEQAVQDSNSTTFEAAARSAATEPLEQAIATLPWISVASMHQARIAHAVASFDGLVYVVGGVGGGNTVEVYNPRSDSWSFRKPFPIMMDHGWAAAIDERLYVGDGNSNRVFTYDPRRDEWSEVAPAHFRHGGTPAVGVIGGRIYIVGGTGDQTRGVEAEVYDPSANRWTILPPMDCARNHTVGGVIESRLHVVGGRPGDQTCHEVFEPATNTWSRRADLPTARSGAAGAVVGGWLIVFGGEFNPNDPDLVFPDVEAYDSEADAWTALPAMPIGRHGLGAATLGDTIYLPGGGRRTRATARVDAFVFMRRKQ